MPPAPRWWRCPDRRAREGCRPRVRPRATGSALSSWSLSGSRLLARGRGGAGGVRTGPAVAEARIAFDRHQLAALVLVLDVDHPEAPGPEPGGLLGADRPEDLAGAEYVPWPHRLVEDHGVVAHHRLGETQPFLEIKMDLQRKGGPGAPGCPVVRPEPHRHHGRRGDGPAGHLFRHLVVPEQGVAVLHR